MFVIECPQHGSQVLVTERRIRALRNTARGILLEVECWCGQRVVIRTGQRQRPGSRQAAPAVASGVTEATCPA